jgi:hypothetical protein
LRALAAVAILCAAPVARADESPPPVMHHEKSRVVFLGLRYDLGHADAFGIGILHAHEEGTSSGGLGFFGYFGYGLDLRLVSADRSAVDAWLTSAVARLSGMGDAGGSAAEVAVGVGHGADGWQGAAHAGFFIEFYYLGIGYTYQFPLGPFTRPDWLSSHQFSVRIHAPLYRYRRRERDETVRSEARASAPRSGRR